MFRDDNFDFTDSKTNNVAKECDNKRSGPAAKKTRYGNFNATYDEVDSRFEVLEFKVNAMEREMESLRKWEAKKSEMTMTMKTLEKELKSKDKELKSLKIC